MRYLQRGFSLLFLFAIIVRCIALPTQVVEVAAQGNSIRWVDFGVSAAAMKDALEMDIQSYTTDCHIGWITLLSCYAAQTAGNFSSYKKEKLQQIFQQLQSGVSPQEVGKSEKLFQYYQEAYQAVLGGMVGIYWENGKQRYGLCAFSPIAKGYSFSHSDDFGVARSYGYRRKHLGHDLMGSVGTPIIAVESGYVEAVGWNQYGGWRIGIRSFDSKRYYYYAHLRRNHPYNDMYEGKIVNAGEVIGYLGMTGYSTKENTNNIQIPHLHYGMQLIFTPEQKDGVNQIWIDMYQITLFLESNRSSVRKNEKTGEYESVNEIVVKGTPD